LENKKTFCNFASNIDSMKNTSDIIGISASFLCMLHCLFAPLLISITYLEWLMLPYMDYVFIGLTIIALFITMKHLHNSMLKILFPIAFTILIVGILNENILILDIPLHIIGSVLLISMHIWNIFSCK
jgi:hypothetical protein